MRTINRLISKIKAGIFLAKKRRGTFNVKGFLVFGAIIYISFWLGGFLVDAISGATGASGWIALAMAALVPTFIAYYAWYRVMHKRM